MDKMQQRKLSKYGSEAVVSVKPIEGCWVLVASQNYRDYLRTIGVGRCGTCHVSRVTRVMWQVQRGPRHAGPHAAQTARGAGVH